MALNTDLSELLTSQTEMGTKVLEAKYQEEKLKLQQRHDADVQKVFLFFFFALHTETNITRAKE